MCSVSPTISPYWYNAAEVIVTESNKTVAAINRLREQLVSVSSLASDLVVMPSSVWSGPSKRRLMARSMDVLSFSDRLSMILDDLTASHDSITLLAGRIAANLSDLSRLHFNQTLPTASLASLSAETELNIKKLTSALEGASYLMDRIKPLLDTPPSDITPVSLRSAGSVSIDARVLNIVTSRKSSPESVAAALLSASGSSALDAFRYALAAGVFKQSFARSVKRLVMRSGPKPVSLNASISDWRKNSASAKRHPVFLDLPVYDKKPSPMDVVQGAVGDCWLMASLATLAHHHPDVISSMVKDNFDGTYSVHFADGEVVTVSGDVWLQPGVVSENPESEYGGYSTVLYGARARSDRPAGGPQWPWIIEKAMATRYGSYGNLNAGMPAWALGVLYNKETFTQQMQPDGSLYQWENLKKGVISPAFEVAPDGVGSSPLDERMLSNPTVVGIKDHAYAVLGVTERNGEQYARLYNPYGTDDIDLKDKTVQVIKGKNDGIMLIKLSDLGRAGVFTMDGFK